MPILSQTLKGHNSETIRPFELKFFVEIYFDQLYLGSTREVLGIDQSIAINMLSMSAVQQPYCTLDLPESWDIERFFSSYTVSDSFFRAESEYQH